MVTIGGLSGSLLAFVLSVGWKKESGSLLTLPRDEKPAIIDVSFTRTSQSKIQGGNT